MIDQSSLFNEPDSFDVKGMNSTDPRYYFWKAKKACSQAESICNVARFTEKVIWKLLTADDFQTYITYFMLGSNALAIVFLIFNGIYILGQTSVVGIKRGSSWINQLVLFSFQRQDIFFRKTQNLRKKRSQSLVITSGN